MFWKQVTDTFHKPKNQENILHKSKASLKFYIH